MKTKWIILCLLVVLSLLACPQSIFFETGYPDTDESAGSEGIDVPADTDDTGKITIQVPMISSYLAEAMGISFADPAPASRAFLIVSTVDFYLYDSGTTLVDSWTYTSPAGEEGPSGSSEDLTTRTVPAADGYTLRADVFNSAVSTVSPMLRGTSASFNITSGESTDVTIRPIPLSTTAVDTADTAVALPDASFTSTYWDGITYTDIVMNDPDQIPDSGDEVYMPFYAWGKEHWFEIDNSASPLDVMRITASPDSLSAIYMMVADSTGNIRSGVISGGGTGENGWTVGTDATLALLTPDSTYYVGLITICDETSSINSTVDISFTASADDAYEENDTVLTATPIAKGTVISGIDLDHVEENIENNWPVTGGDLYEFTVTSGEDPANIDIYLVFDHDQGDLSLKLFDDTGFELDSANESSGDGTSAEEQETILDPAGLSIGSTYYILVGGNGWSWPVGNTYQLQWVSGDGTINIGLE